MQSVIAVLYKYLPLSESNKSISAPKLRRLSNSNGSTLFDRGWQQPLNHSEAQPARRVKDAEGTAKPLVLDSARWLGYLRVNIATPFTFRRKSHFENYR